MKKMSLKGKSIKIVIVLAIIVLISMLYALSAIKQENNVANAAILENQCDGDHTGWTPLSETGGIIAAGDYYLDDNITLLNNIVINTGTVNLCLNGKILTGAIGSDDSIFQVYGSGVLNIYDCNSDSDVHPYIIKEVFPDATQDLYYGYPQYSSKMFQRYYDFTGIGDGVIVGGVITGGHKYSTSTDLKNNFYYPGGGSAILIGSESAMDLGGTVNMYGGTISGNTVTALSQFGGKRERAGAVCVKDGGNFNMYGGAIRGNSARMVGAALYLFGGNSDAYRANAKLYGGIITDNYGLDTVYNYSNQSGWDSVGAFATDNVMPGSSVISIEGNPYISGNYGYSFTVAPNTYPEANTYFSSETYNVLQVTGKLYKEVGVEKQYARIGLSVDATPSLTSGYTTFGNLPEDVNKVFYADLRTRAVAFNQDTLEVKYAAANLKTLTYVANYDGGSTSNISVVDSISVDSAMFERNGYAFASWNTESSGSGTTYYPNDIITLNSNQTLYAQWNKEQYSINYWLNGGTLSGQNTSYLYGTSYTLPIPTYNSYDFEGWYDNALLEGLAVTSVTTTDFGNKTFYAKWSDAIFYTITSTSGSNGTISPLGSIIYDGTSQDYRIVPKSGYKVATFTVDGIDKKNQIINNVYTINNVTSDTDIEVTFEKIVLGDITFYATSTAGGTISPSGYTVVQLFDNITFTITPQPGYKISDVKVNNVSVGPTVNYSFIHVYKGFAVHAEFVSCMEELVLNKNGGTFIESYEEPVLYEEGIGLTLPLGGEIIRQGYVFDGWYLTEDFDGEPVTEVLSTDSGKKEFFAKWIEATTFITLNKNGADADETVTATYGSTLPSFSALSRSGYTLNGYFTTISGNIKLINADGTLVPNISGYTDASGNWENTSANLALFAQWSLNSIVIASTSGYTGAFDNASHNITITASHELSSNYTLTYQWYKDSVSEDNKVGTNSSYPVKDNVDSGSYICVVSITDGTQTASETSSEVTVSISRVDISDAVITLGDNLIYNGQEQTQTIASVVVDTLNVTYTVSGNKQTNHSASGYTLTVTGSDNFSGTATKTWNIATQKVNKPTEDNSNFVYNGTEQTYLVASDSRFSITDDTRTDAGSQSVTVALIDKINYEWTDGGVENVVFNFSIAQKDIADAVITLGSSLIYNGQEQTQTIASVVADTLNVTYTVSGNKQTNHSASGYTLTITGSGNFSGTATKVWNISKASYDMSGVTFESKTIKADNNIKSIAISGQLPEGVSVRYEGNGKSVAGVYTVTAIFVYDSVNYNSIANKTATLTLLLPQISETAEGNDTEKPDIIVSSEKGFEPDLELIISVISNESIELELGKNSVLSKAYGVRLVRGEENIELTDEITVRLLIPRAIQSETFKIYSGENSVDFSIDDGYAVFDIDSLSNLAFVYEVEKGASLLWLIIVLAILLLAEIALAVYKILKDRKSKKAIKTFAFAPLFLSAVIPTGQIAATIILGVLCGIVALFDIYLFLIKDRFLKKNINENAEQEVSKAEIWKIGTVLENNETALDLITDEDDDEAEQLKGIEENNGLAILVRYRKAFLAKLIQSPEETKGYYSLLKNAILSYEKTSSHISFNYDSINRGRKKLAKFNIRGKTLYLYLALSPKPFANSKYKVEPSDKKKYIETPCLYKIKNELRAKYALELIAGMAEKFGIKKGTEQNIDYNLPYQTTEELIAKGLIKELVSKKNYEEWKRFQNQSTVNRKKRTFVSASEVNDILRDEVAAALIVEKKKENAAPKKEKAIINIDSISANFGQGETVSIQTLNEKGIINNKVNYIKILARGRLDKPLTIEASDFSMEAVKMILLTGGKVIKIV